MAHSNLLSSAKLILYVNGSVFGRVAGFHYTVETPRRKMQTVDSTIPVELGNATSNVSGSMSIYRSSLDGAAEGAGMVAPLEQLPNEMYFTIMIVDLVTQVAIFQADFCSVEAQGWSMDAKGMVTGNVNFSALSYNNEVRPLG